MFCPVSQLVWFIHRYRNHTKRLRDLQLCAEQAHSTHNKAFWMVSTISALSLNLQISDRTHCWCLQSCILHWVEFYPIDVCLPCMNTHGDSEMGPGLSQGRSSNKTAGTYLRFQCQCHQPCRTLTTSVPLHSMDLPLPEISSPFCKA